MKTLEKKFANPSKNSARKEKETKRKDYCQAFYVTHKRNEIKSPGHMT